MRKETEALKNQLRKDRKPPVRREYLHTGSVLLNLACTSNVRKGIAKGTYVLYVGDTFSGKTWIGHTCFAEACLDPAFKSYRLIYDNTERGAYMDIGFYFGEKVAERIEPPQYDQDGVPLYSATIEELYFNLDDALDEKTPFIYVVDSIDALSSDPEEKKFDEHKAAMRKGTDAKGDYGDGKAKVSSRYLRRIVTELSNTGSILIVLNQTRDNLGAGPFEKQKKRSGGWALEFYAHLVLWSSVAGKVTKVVNGKTRELGIKSKIRVEKNRFTGKRRTVEIPILHSFGIDNIGSMVDFMIDEKGWKKASKGGMISVTGLGPEFKMRRDDIIKKIEEDEMEEDLMDLVQETWDGIEDACKVERKSRYRS